MFLTDAMCAAVIAAGIFIRLLRSWAARFWHSATLPMTAPNRSCETFCSTAALRHLPPVAQSRKGNLRLIRPLAFVTEDLSTEYARVQGFLPISCVCGEKESVRREIREFLDAMKSRHLGISESITASLGNVNPYTLFSTPDLVGVGTEDEMEF